MSTPFSRKGPPQDTPRPETKVDKFLTTKRDIPLTDLQVYQSSTAHIARLMENLSNNRDAGAFNFSLAHGIGHSASSSITESDVNWTVEERLDHMLGAISRD
jgi:hypothetical protein